MVYYLLTCRSLTYAQKTVRALERAGITAIVVKVPREISAEGCGYSVRISEKWLSQALMTLKSAGLYPIRIFVKYDDGKLNEVRI